MRLLRNASITCMIFYLNVASEWTPEPQTVSSLPMSSVVLGSSVQEMGRSLLWRGVVGMIAPKRWWSCALTYTISVLAWAILSTVLIFQLAVHVRPLAIITAPLGFLVGFALYVLAWGLPTGFEWIWAVCLNLWQGVGCVRTIRKRGGYANILSADGIKDVLRMPSSPLREQFFGKELFHFWEPGTPPVIDPQWCLDAKAEFGRNTKLGMVFGHRRGQVYFRVSFLEQVLKKRSNQIYDWSSLIKAFGECGYDTKKL